MRQDKYPAACDRNHESHSRYPRQQSMDVKAGVLLRAKSLTTGLISTLEGDFNENQNPEKNGLNSLEFDYL